MHVRCIPEHVKRAIIIMQQGFLDSDLMHSYKTITNTNNNFITLALAVITVSVHFMTLIMPQVTIHSQFMICFSLCQHSIFMNSSRFNRNDIMML